MDRVVKNDRVVGIIQARIGSTRLPAKILAPIVGSLPLIAVLTERIRPAGIPLWLATTQTKTDDVTAAWGHELGLHVFRGDEHDVLSRFAAIVAMASPDWVVRFTADDPFTDAAITTRAIELAMSAPDHVDLLTAGPSRQFPLGYAPQLARATAIAQLARTLPEQGTHHRVHVTSGIEPSRIASIQDPTQPARPDWRWTVDTVEDLAMAQAAFAAASERGIRTQYGEFVSILDERSDITDINSSVRQKALDDG
jgi:spore coat polysaccharide biosynthesis protein SpsF